MTLNKHIPLLSYFFFGRLHCQAQLNWTRDLLKGKNQAVTRDVLRDVGNTDE